MNRLQFGEGACDKTRKYLDSYVSSELLVETNHEILRHLEGCQSCSAELEVRARIRTGLKTAVTSQAAPPELAARIRRQIEDRNSGSWFRAGWTRWGLAIAAVLAVCAGVWLNYVRQKLPDLADRPAQNAYIQRVSASLAAVLKLGLGDHIHCSIFRKYPQNPPPVETMEADLGPSYQGLLPVVRAAVPEGYGVLMAHQCSYLGRKYVHLTLEKDGGLLSLVVTRKNPGESFAGLPVTAGPAGVEIHQSQAGRYRVAGFEAGNFLAYVVSSLNEKDNLEIAANLAPAVRELLLHIPA